MNGYSKVFPNAKTFIAVIHATDEDQALRNASIARDNGADGVFLINHTIEPIRLVAIGSVVQASHAKYWVGMNLLGMSPVAALSKMPPRTGGLWVDNAGVQEFGNSPEAALFAQRRGGSSWRGLYFGGVAFKYQPRVGDPGRVAKLAIPYVDVVTTSGTGTGKPPEPAKIKKMKTAIGKHPLAIASGLTVENISDYPDADCFIVAGGISDTFTELNHKLVREFAYNCHL